MAYKHGPSLYALLCAMPRCSLDKPSTPTPHCASPTATPSSLTSARDTRRAQACSQRVLCASLVGHKCAVQLRSCSEFSTLGHCHSAAHLASAVVEHVPIPFELLPLPYMNQNNSTSAPLASLQVEDVPTLHAQCVTEQRYLRGAMTRSLIYTQGSIGPQKITGLDDAAWCGRNVGFVPIPIRTVAKSCRCVDVCTCQAVEVANGVTSIKGLVGTLLRLQVATPQRPSCLSSVSLLYLSLGPGTFIMQGMAE
eukprot:1161968-Pelagomonas_calceolata.AAC.8